MIYGSIDELVVTGCLGPLRMGISPEEVLRLFGPPQDVGATRSTKFLWKYGDLLLDFARDQSKPPKRRLWFIGLYFRDGPFHTTAPLELCGWIPQPWTQPKECEEHFRALGVSYHP
ncbi:MAG: hypothetical protein NZM42_14810, partial [Gemmatales bacterium]|nr:hypothetical protein [Gemmatales bacterium]